MKVYEIPVYWSIYGTAMIEAESLDEAITIVENDNNGLDKIENQCYLDDSFQIDYEIINERNQ